MVPGLSYLTFAKMEKLKSLLPEQRAEVEDFVDFLKARQERDSRCGRPATRRGLRQARRAELAAPHSWKKSRPRSARRAPSDAPVMRSVADTNTVLSGLLWQGPPRRLIDLARQGAFSHPAPAPPSWPSSPRSSRGINSRSGCSPRASPPQISCRTTPAWPRSSSHNRCLPRPAVIRMTTTCSPARSPPKPTSSSPAIATLLDLREYHGIPIFTTADALQRLEA
jgi:hypothetical protein